MYEKIEEELGARGRCRFEFRLIISRLQAQGGATVRTTATVVPLPCLPVRQLGGEPMQEGRRSGEAGSRISCAMGAMDTSQRESEREK